MISQTPPDDLISLVKLREGFKPTVYADTATPPKLTAGYGHMLLANELAVYHKGSVVPTIILDQWFENDITKAYTVARQQAALIGSQDQRLVNALACIIFQMGSAWNLPVPHGKGFVNTWQLLMQHRWVEAAAGDEHSAWARETPTRFNDFKLAMKVVAAGPEVAPVQPALAQDAPEPNGTDGEGVFA